MKKKILIALAVILLLLIGAFFFIVPAQLEKRLNVSLNAPPYLASERAVEREQFISDNRTSLDLAFSLDHNRYQGNEYLELSVSDFRTLGPA